MNNTGACRAVALAILVAGLASCGPGRVPADQAPLVTLTGATGLDPVRLPFNAAQKEIRVVLLLSPT